MYELGDDVEDGVENDVEGVEDDIGVATEYGVEGLYDE